VLAGFVLKLCIFCRGQLLIISTQYFATHRKVDKITELYKKNDNLPNKYSIENFSKGPGLDGDLTVNIILI